MLPLCLLSLHGLEGTHVQGAQCPRVVVKCSSPAASHHFSPVSRFVQLLEKVLCYLIPVSEDSMGTFNALRVSMCQASLPLRASPHKFRFSGSCSVSSLIQ